MRSEFSNSTEAILLLLQGLEYLQNYMYVIHEHIQSFSKITATLRQCQEKQ